MLKLLRELEFLSTGIWLKLASNNWKVIRTFSFAVWKYSHQHMKISDTDAAHCATDSLGGTCYHEHSWACEHWTRLATFLDMSFVSCINYILLKQLNYDQLLPETNTMINSVLHLNIMVKHYTGHRVRSVAQFNIIYKINNECLKGYKSSCFFLG